MTNKKKRKRSPPKTAAAARAVNSSPLLMGIRDRRRRHAEQYAVFLQFDLLPRAFDELLARYQYLASLKGISLEVANLLNDAQRWIIDGVDHILGESTPHSVEEARKILELEYLLRDFAATPASLEKWSAVEPWVRQGPFGFGNLRSREEARQGLDQDMVIAARDYWITHSIDSHPKPTRDVAPKTDEDPSWSMLSSLGDLLEHARSTLDAAILCVEALGINIPEQFYRLRTDALQESSRRIHQVLHPMIPTADYEAMRMPRPKKQSPRRHWDEESESAPEVS